VREVTAYLTPDEFAKLGLKAPPLAEKRSKYHAKQVVVTDDGQLYDAKAAKANGIVGKRFDSKAEARRYLHLKIMERAGHIKDLACQATFALHGHDGTYVASYRADFVYLEPREYGPDDWGPVVEDVKGMSTPLYKLKKKLVEAEYGVTIREIR
jgi:hypothetical protein